MDHRNSRRTFLTGVAAVGATLGLPKLATAQSFPDKSKPIRGIVPFPVGASVDAVARPYAQAMGTILGTTIVIENRTGADGLIGSQAVKAAAPDGYTILFTSLSSQVVGPHLYRQLPYDPLKDFIPLAGTVKSTFVLYVGPSLSSFASFKDFAQAAKANPGKYSYASVSPTTRLSAELIAKAAGIELLNVPYKNYSDLVSDLLSARIDMVTGDVVTGAPYAKKGMRPIAVCVPSRIAELPDVPTFEELGVKGINIIGWHGTWAPAGTPPATVKTLRDAVVQAGKSKIVQDFLTNFGGQPLELSGDEFAAFQQAEYEKWGRVAREAGLQGTL